MVSRALHLGTMRKIKALKEKKKHASSIGSDERNLDIPKQLKSSEQCLVPGVIWHRKYRRWQVSWYEEKACYRGLVPGFEQFVPDDAY